MKRAIVGVLTAAMVLSVGVTSAFAAGRGCGRGHGRNYSNANKNAVCSNYTGACSFVDEDGDGICDNCNGYHKNCLSGNGCGQNYTDADGDGVCDNYQGCGQGRGRGRGRGRGCGFGGGRNR